MLTTDYLWSIKKRKTNKKIKRDMHYRAVSWSALCTCDVPLSIMLVTGIQYLNSNYKIPPNLKSFTKGMWKITTEGVELKVSHVQKVWKVGLGELYGCFNNVC